MFENFENNNPSEQIEEYLFGFEEGQLVKTTEEYNENSDTSGEEGKVLRAIRIEHRPKIEIQTDKGIRVFSPEELEPQD